MTAVANATTRRSRPDASSTDPGGKPVRPPSPLNVRAEGIGAAPFALQLALRDELLPDTGREAGRRGDPGDRRPFTPLAQPRLVVEPGEFKTFLERLQRAL